MGIISHIQTFFRFSGPAPQVQRLVEAHGVTIDNDDADWRPLTGDARRDITPMTQRRMRDLSLYLWESNLLANRLIELPLAYLLADGVSVDVNDPEAKRWIDAFWRDPINNMDIKLSKKIRELALFGEQCWPAFTNEHNGHVRLGYLDPALIETVVSDPDNTEQVIGIVTTKNKKGDARRFKIIVNGPEAMFSRRTQQIRESFVDGECFYFTINSLSNGKRGRADLLPQIDWLDAYDHYLFGELDRADFLRSFIWDVTLKGADEQTVKERAKQITPPSPGSTRVHNDSEEWKAETPTLNAADTSEIARLIRNHVLGGATVPEHWFGGGGDVNRATAEDMSGPTFKMFSMRQREIKYILEEVIKYQINQRLVASNHKPIDPAEPDPDFLPRVNFPEMIARDTTKYAAALQQIAMGSIMMIEKGLLSKLTAIRLVQTVAERLGMEIDAEEELEAATEERAQEQEADVFVDPAAGDDDG